MSRSSDCYSEDLNVPYSVNVWQHWMMNSSLMPVIPEDNFDRLASNKLEQSENRKNNVTIMPKRSLKMTTFCDRRTKQHQ